MKILLTAFLTLLAIQNAKGQCYPVFKEMEKQPPSLGSDYNISIGYGLNNSPHSLFYTTHFKPVSLQGGIDGNYIIYNIWDGNNWTTLKEFKMTGFTPALVKWGNRLIAYGTIKSFDSIKPPPGKNFAFLEYKNGQWDTLPGGTIDRYINSVAVTKDGLYYATDSIGDLYHRHGALYKYDESSKKFKRIIDLEGSFNGYVDIRGTDNRLLINGVSIVNGKYTRGFCYIENDSIKLIKDSTLSWGFCVMDPITERLYYTAAADSLIREFSDSFTGLVKRAPGSLGYLPTSFVVFNDCIVIGPYRQSNDVYTIVNCKGETQWKYILNRSDGVVDFTYIVSSKTGIYTYNYTSKKVLELTNGAMVKGTVFLDADSNCNRNPKTDKGLVRKYVSFVSDKFRTMGITDDSGRYEVYVLPDTFKVKGPGPLAACADTIITIKDSFTNFKDFPTKIPQFYDIKVKLLGGFSARWNSPWVYQAQIENAGPPFDSAYFEFRLDPKITLQLQQDSTITSMNGTIARGQIKDLGYFDKRIINVKATIDASKTKPDSILRNGFSAYLYRPDINLKNNRDSFNQKVVYSFDPNHKDCNQDTIPKNKGSKLEYYIGFQNEGNDDAINIEIRDTLSASLISDSVKLLGVSHEYSLTKYSNILVFNFYNIHLKPKSKDEANSTGYIKFSVYTKGNLMEGDSIANKAHIFFDLNQSIITNNATVRVPKTPKVSLQSSTVNNYLHAGPNPFEHFIRINLPGENIPLSIYNATGKLMYSEKAQTNLTEIDSSTWPPGLYILRCGSINMKLIKI